MYGIGNDIVYIPRVVKLVQSYGDRFARKFLHPKEFESYKARSSAKNAITFLAGRWGVKEATYKALGTRNVAFTDLWVKEGPRGKPEVIFDGDAKRLLEELEISKIHVAITHDHEYAMANVILEKNSK
jgi:holo-[acyl-carrier protein] synthase